MRVSEVCGLTWDNCQANANSTATVTLFGKGAKVRHIVVSADTWAEMQGIKGEAPGGAPVFRSRKGGHLNRASVHRVIKKVAAKAGVTDDVSAHWFRHSHATHAVDRGVALSLIQATLGIAASPRLNATYTRTQKTAAGYTYLYRQM